MDLRNQTPIKKKSISNFGEVIATPVDRHINPPFDLLSTTFAMASKKLIVPVMTNEHFQHQQQQFDKKPIRFQLLDHQGLKMNSLTTFAWLNYIKFAAQVNEMSTLFDDDGKGGYEILSDAAVQAYNTGKEPDHPLGPNPTLEEQEKWNKSLTRMANSTAALKADKVERRKRSDEAGRFLSEIMLPSIKPEAIALFTSKWATESDSDHFEIQCNSH